MEFLSGFSEAELLSYVSIRAEEIHDEQQKLDSSQKLSKRLSNRIKQLREQISADIEFNKSHKTEASRLLSECQTLEAEQSILKEKIVNSSFVEVPQSLSLGKEPVSTSIQNVHLPTQKVIYGRILGFLFAEKAKLKQRNDEVLRLHKSVFCTMDGAESDLLLSEFQIPQEKSLSQTICGALEDSAKASFCPCQNYAASQLEDMFSKQTSCNFTETNQLQFKGSHCGFEHNNSDTHYCDYLVDIKSTSELSNTVEQMIDEMLNIGHLNEQIPQSLIDKIANLSGVLSIRSLSSFSDAQESINKSQRILNKLASVYNSGMFVPAKVSEAAESIRKKSSFLLRHLKSATKRSLTTSAMKSTLPIEYPTPSTIDVEEIDCDQVNEVTNFIQTIDTSLKSQIELQLKMINGMKVEQREEEQIGQNERFSCELLDEIQALQTQIIERQNQDIDILGNAISNIPLESIGSVEIINENKSEDVLSADPMIDTSESFPARKKVIYRIKGIDQPMNANDPTPNYKPQIDVNQTFIMQPENKHLSLIKSHFKMFQDRISSIDNDPTIILLERKESLTTELSQVSAELTTKERKMREEARANFEKISENLHKTQLKMRKVDDLLPQNYAANEELDNEIKKLRAKLGITKQRAALQDNIEKTQKDREQMISDMQHEKDRIKTNFRRH